MTLADLRHFIRPRSALPGVLQPPARQAACMHDSPPPTTLADVPPGRQVQVASFLAGLSSERQSHLRAYGLAPGMWVRVKQHKPVTVVQIDHTELALEDTLARQVSVLFTETQ